MRRNILALLACAMLWLSAGSHPVRGDTGSLATPSPVPTATTVGRPDPAHVVDLMMRAWQAAPSDHFTMTQRSSFASGRNATGFATTQVGDIAWKANPPIFEMAGPTVSYKRTTAGATTKRAREIQLFDQNLLAIKLGKGKWSCNHFFGYDSLPGSPLWNSTSPYGMDARNLGTSRINGVLAWHVRASQIDPGAKGSKTPKHIVTLDFFASTSDYLPVKIHTSLKYWVKNGYGTATTTMLFSHFGEDVHVNLPSVCASA